MKGKIEGQQITLAKTSRTWFDNNCIECNLGNGEIAKLNANEILKMMKEFQFTVEKKTKHSYLINPELISKS